MIRDKQDKILRICWMYYMGDMSQKEIAEELGISRLLVNQMLSMAKREKLIKISFGVPTEALELQEELKKKFNLKSCLVFPDIKNKIKNKEKSLNERKEKIGVMSSNFFLDILEKEKVKVLATSWGRSITSIIEHIDINHSFKDMTCISAMGSFTQTCATNPLDISLKTALKLRGAAHLLLAPFIVNSIKDMEVLVSQPIIKQSLDLLNKAELLLAGIGRVDQHSLFNAPGILDKNDLSEAFEKGAVGEILGIFFDEKGEQVDCKVNRHRIGGSYEMLKRVRTVCPVVNVDLTVAIRVAIKYGLINDLITNISIAKELLK